MLLSRCLVVVSIVFGFDAKPLKSPKIIIVGAGLSGVAAASKLIENGFSDIIIYEAEPRIGGRIFSFPFANGMIDLGAQWVHGETNNVVYDLMHGHFEFGSTGFDETDLFFLNSNAVELDQDQCMRLYNLSEDILTRFNAQARFRGSLGDFFKQQFRRGLRSFQFKDITPQLSLEIQDYFEKEVNNWNGSDTWDAISSHGNTLSGVNDGNQYQTWRKEGYMTVFNYLTKALPDPSKYLGIKEKVQLNTKVVNINRDPKSRTSKVVVTLQDGSKHAADHVIFTGSLGVLKKNHKTLFTPKLPARKVLAIETSGYGTLGKVFLEYEVPFWPIDLKDWVGYSFLWTEEDKASVMGTAREWLISLQLFVRLDFYPNVIEGMVSGKNLDKFELLDDQTAIDDCTWMMEKFLGRSLPRPISIKKTRWMTKENFWGSYSYQSLDADQNGILPKDLAKSLFNVAFKPQVLFAGEATDSQFSSNAHGAVTSGWRAANELVAYLNN